MNITECAELLKAHDNYLIATHRRPDGDTIGSAAALCHALRRLGKTAHVFRNPEITENYLPFAEPFFPPEGYLPEHNLAVDVASDNMLCSGFSGEIFLAVDHHANGGITAENIIVWPHMAAAGEVVLALLDELLGGPDEAEANYLYIAVSTDTGCFRHANTTADTFRDAARLLEAGADLMHLNKLLFKTRSRSRLMLESLVYTNMKSYLGGSLNTVCVTLDMMAAAGATENDCDDLASLLGCVKGCTASITVREISVNPPASKISLRTSGEVDAAKVCALFGGGGHKMAAGCELKLPPEEAEAALRKAVEEAWA